MFSTKFLPVFSGAALQARLLIKELKELGINSFVLTNRRHKGLKSTEILDGIRIFRKPILPFKIPFIPDLYDSLQLSFFIIRFYKKYDILHFHGGFSAFSFLPLFINKYLGKKSIFKMTLLKSPCDPAAWKKHHLGLLLRFSFQYFDKIISISNPLTKNYLHSKLGKNKLIKMRQAVNTKLFFPYNESDKLKLRKKLNIDRKKIVLTFTGSVKKRKGVDILVEIFSKLSKKYDNLVLIIIGEHLFDDLFRQKYALFSNKIKETLNNLGIYERVIFTNNISNVEEYLYISDIFIFPSRREGLPNSVLEAMSVALPCVLAPLNGIAEEIKGNSESLLISKQDKISEYVAILDDLIKSDKTRKMIGENGRNRILEKYDSKKVAKDYMNFYKELII